MKEKRFKVTDNTNNPYLCDWSVTDYADGGIVDHPMTSENMANVICDLLNELAEENQRLKNDCSILVQSNQDYRAENEQLKQSNKDAWNLIQFIYNEIKEDGYMDWGRIQDLVEF